MEKVTLNLIEVDRKARSKSELYRLLTMDGNLYLPPYKHYSVDFMADIIEGRRKALEIKDVCIRYLPHIADLNKEDLTNLLITDCYSEHYLSPKYDQIVLHRDCVANLCKYIIAILPRVNSINPAAFGDYVQNKLLKRQQKIMKKKSPNSAHKEKSHLMLNRSRRYEKEAKECAEVELKTAQKINPKTQLWSQILARCSRGGKLGASCIR